MIRMERGDRGNGEKYKMEGRGKGRGEEGRDRKGEEGVG